MVWKKNNWDLNLITPPVAASHRSLENALNGTTEMQRATCSGGMLEDNVVSQTKQKRKRGRGWKGVETQVKRHINQPHLTCGLVKTLVGIIHKKLLMCTLTFMK